MDSTSSLDLETHIKKDVGEFQTPDSNRDKRKQSTGVSSQPSKVKRILPTRSEVWEHYTRTKEDKTCVYATTVIITFRVSPHQGLQT
ncbi:unnamed protein product [Brassica oleracea]